MRRVLLRLDQRLLAAVEVDVDQQQPCLDASDVDEWKEDVNRLRLGTYAALLQIASEKSYGKA